MQRSKALSLFAVLVGVGVALAGVSPAAADWTRRMGDAQNTGNAGNIAALTPETVRDLGLVALHPVGSARSTPVASGDLVVLSAPVEGDTGDVQVIDLESGKVLVTYDPATLPV